MENVIDLMCCVVLSFTRSLCFHFCSFDHFFGMFTVWFFCPIMIICAIVMLLFLLLGSPPSGM